MPNQNPKFRSVGVARLSQSQQTVKFYSDAYGFLGLARVSELKKLLAGELDFVGIVIFDPTTQQQDLKCFIKPVDPEKLQFRHETASGELRACDGTRYGRTITEVDKIKCWRCGRANSKYRSTCWGCGEELSR